MEIETLQLDDDGTWPNNPRLPVLIYRHVLKNPVPGDYEDALTANRWGNCWRNGVYAYHHYHSNTHEFLGCFAGDAHLQLGGPCGETLFIEAGDALLLPADTAHKLIDSARDFAVVGAYPQAIDFDTLTGEAGEHDEAVRAIRVVAVPNTDPLYGAEGPLYAHWVKAAES